MKKYIEKRWVATLKIPEIPPMKSYRNQETLVIEFVSSGELFRLRQGHKSPSFLESKALKIMRRGEEIAEMETREASKESPKDTLSVKDTAPDSSSTSQFSADAIFDNDLDEFATSFKYQIMSPRIVHSSQSSTSAAKSQVSSFDPPLILDTVPICLDECGSEAEGIITVMVCDMGTQTDY